MVDTGYSIHLNLKIILAKKYDFAQNNRMGMKNKTKVIRLNDNTDGAEDISSIGAMRSQLPW